MLKQNLIMVGVLRIERSCGRKFY